MGIVEFTEKDVNVRELIEEMKTETTGAVVVFFGTVKKKAKTTDGDVQQVVVSADLPSSTQKLKDISHEVIKEYDLVDLSVLHRVGKLNVSDVMTLVVATASHRKEAFRSAQAMLARLGEVPVSKEEVLENNSG